MLLQEQQTLVEAVAVVVLVQMVLPPNPARLAVRVLSFSVISQQTQMQKVYQ